MAPDDVLKKKKLPLWFPGTYIDDDEAFEGRILSVDIDKFKNLDYEQSLYVYNNFIRSAHKKSLICTSRPLYETNDKFKWVFSFLPFNPPWFVVSIDCRFRGKSVYTKSLWFEDTGIPCMRLLRSRVTPKVVRLQGLIAAFYSMEPDLDVLSIDYFMTRAGCSSSKPPRLLSSLHTDHASRNENEDDEDNNNTNYDYNEEYKDNYNDKINNGGGDDDGENKNSATNNTRNNNNTNSPRTPAQHSAHSNISPHHTRIAVPTQQDNIANFVNHSPPSNSSADRGTNFTLTNPSNTVDRTIHNLSIPSSDNDPQVEEAPLCNVQTGIPLNQKQVSVTAPAESLPASNSRLKSLSPISEMMVDFKSRPDFSQNTCDDDDDEDDDFELPLSHAAIRPSSERSSKTKQPTSGKSKKRAHPGSIGDQNSSWSHFKRRNRQSEPPINVHDSEVEFAGEVAKPSNRLQPWRNRPNTSRTQDNSPSTISHPSNAVPP